MERETSTVQRRCVSQAYKKEKPVGTTTTERNVFTVTTLKSSPKHNKRRPTQKENLKEGKATKISQKAKAKATKMQKAKAKVKIKTKTSKTEKETKITFQKRQKKRN